MFYSYPKLRKNHNSAIYIYVGFVLMSMWSLFAETANNEVLRLLIKQTPCLLYPKI